VGTWVACIVETKNRRDFWTVARELGVRPTSDAVPDYALIDCDCGFDFLASDRVATGLSRRLSTMAIGFLVQTTSDCHTIRTYVNGACVRRLDYSRDEGGWLVIEGVPQLWERAYFLGGDTDDSGWPEMLDEDASESDLARCQEARRSGDPSPVLALLHPSSTAPMRRVCASFGIADNTRPSGTWKKQPFWSRLFRSA
jgi:hypothetical protein